MEKLKRTMWNFEDFVEETGDFYSKDVRQQKLDDDELDPWEAAWMQGYDEAG